MKRRRLAPLCCKALVLATLATATGAANVGEARRSATDRWDCGPAALFMLAQVMGLPIDRERIDAQLPTRRGGHSMLELRDAAARVGLKLAGGDIGRDGQAINRPMITFLKNDEDQLRHFLVIRPVGHSGSLVQVIDTLQPPHIMNRADLVRSDQWTGLVLVQERPSWLTPGSLGLVLLLALPLLGLALGRWRRFRTVGVQNAPATPTEIVDPQCPSG